MKIKINADGYVEGPYTQNATIGQEVTKEQFNQVMNMPVGKRWHYIKNKGFQLETIESTEILRERRYLECFMLIDNRSQMWYDHLTESQKQELDAWYLAWLDVTKTKIIPEKPEWLK